MSAERVTYLLGLTAAEINAVLGACSGIEEALTFLEELGHVRAASIAGVL